MLLSLFAVFFHCTCFLTESRLGNDLTILYMYTAEKATWGNQDPLFLITETRFLVYFTLLILLEKTDWTHLSAFKH